MASCMEWWSEVVPMDRSELEAMMRPPIADVELLIIEVSFRREMKLIVHQFTTTEYSCSCLNAC